MTQICPAPVHPMSTRWFILWCVAGVLVWGLSPGVASAKRDPAFFEGGALTAWPSPEANLPTNGRVVLVGDRQGSHVLRDVVRDALRMVAGDDVVPVRVVWVSRGQLYAQALLVPERRLHPGRVYALERSSSGDDGDFIPLTLAAFRWREPPEATPARWKVSSGPDLVAPRWGERPSADAPVCGTAMHGDGCSFALRAAVQDGQGEVRVRVDIPRQDAAPLRFFLPVREGRLVWTIGSDVRMYRPHTLGTHKLVLTAVDLAGNGAPSGGQEVTVPSARLEHH